MLCRMPRSRINVRQWITFRSVPWYLIPEGFHKCLHSKQGGLTSHYGVVLESGIFLLFLLQIGHCLLIAAKLIRQASCPFVFSCVVLSTSRASSMAQRAWNWGFKISGPASLFLLAANPYHTWLPKPKNLGLRYGVRSRTQTRGLRRAACWLLWQCTRIRMHCQKCHVYVCTVRDEQIVGKGRMVPLGGSFDAMC